MALGRGRDSLLFGVICVQRHSIAGLVLPALLAVAGQVLAVGPAWAQSPGASGAGIFVPKPRGSEDSFDPGAVAVQTGATVFGRSGDRLTGSVNSIANGVIRFSGAFFDQEVGIFASAIRDIQFPARGGVESGRDLVVLTNGDRLFGKVEGMTAADVAFNTATAGFLKINKRYIRQMWFQGNVDALARTNFAAGHPGPLRIAGGWQISGGVLRVSAPFMATLPLDQSGAVTVVMDFARMGQGWSLSLFSDQPGVAEGETPVRTGPRGVPGAEGSALTLALAPNGYSITSWKGADPPGTVASGVPARPGEPQELRFAYNPATGHVNLWINGQGACEANAPAAPKQGKYVVFGSFRDNCDLKSLAVLDGVVAPGKVLEEADPNYETIFYQSGERSLNAKSTELLNGVYSVKTTVADKPLSVPAEKVVSISMGKAGRETLPPPEHPVQISLPRSLITVDLVELTAKTAVAKSPYLGDIKIVRDMIQSMRFLAPAQ
jgi:hypothetical protein